MALINREDLLAELDGMVYTARDGSDVPRQVRMVVDAIRNAPVVDAVPVVRCGKCKWHENEEPGMVYCPQIVGGWVSENFFCGFGKRKDGGE